jgi:GNAT superfamily N-acetyltransferase
MKVRKATIDDLQAVHRLVYELAVYENEPDAVTSTLDDYIKAFNASKINILVAEEEGDVIGMALYYWAFSTWRGPMMYLEDFVVNATKRRSGVGQLLFDAFLQDSKHRGAVMVKWEVLNWNELAINFYKKNKAIIEKQWYNGKIIF